ncbi:MAG: hypothetical protein KC589_03475 [Nanoarchaeota archaeon]|nr:hypothetical protein [Nanoarchaeota archaeon]
MEFWKCSRCGYNTKFNIGNCPSCKNILDLIIPEDFEVFELTKVFLPSRKHQIVPYNVLLLKDNFGNYYPKKTMKDYEIGDKYDIKKTNLNIIDKDSNSVYLHKHKNLVFADLSLIFENTYLKNSLIDVNDINGGNFQNYFVNNVNEMDVCIRISDWLERAGSVEFKLYLDFLNELLLKFFSLGYSSKQIFLLFSTNKCKMLFEKLGKVSDKLKIKILDVEKLDISFFSNKVSLVNLAHVSQKDRSFLGSINNISDLNLGLFEKILNINYMLVISQRNSFNGPSPYFANLLSSSSDANLNDMVTSELLCEDKLDFVLNDYLLHSEIIGENLEACKVNFFESSKNSSPLSVLRKLYESKILENFVKETNCSWNHQNWEILVAEIKSRNIEIPEEIIGMILERFKLKELNRK